MKRGGDVDRCMFEKHDRVLSPFLNGMAASGSEEHVTLAQNIIIYWTRYERSELRGMLAGWIVDRAGLRAN